jgi:hypothetical protein
MHFFSSLPFRPPSCAQIFSSLPYPRTPSVSLNARDQFSHSYKTTSDIVVMYILVHMFLCNRREGEALQTEIDIWYIC